MKATSRQLQKQASPSVVDIKLGFMMCFFLQFDHLTNFTYLPMSARMVSRFILFCLDLELFEKIKKGLVSAHSLPLDGAHLVAVRGLIH